MGRVGELDGVRGVAILLVIAAHAGGVGLPAGGGVGVTLFFVLSGYLITGLLRRELDARGRVDLRAFWARRARRLVPAFLPVAAFTLLLMAALGMGRRGAILVAVTPVADYVAAAGAQLSPFNHVWSLSVEEQFYLLWPLLLGFVVTRARPARWLVVAAVGFALWRVAVGFVDGWWLYHSLDGNAYALLAGAALAVGGWQAPRWAAVGGLVVLVVVSVLTVPLEVHVALGPVVAAASVAVVAGCRGVWGLSWAPLRYAGRVSYGWYLWHVPVLVLATGAGVAGQWAAAALAWLLAAASWRWVEQPILRARRNAPHPAGEAERGASAVERV